MGSSRFGTNDFRSFCRWPTGSSHSVRCGCSVLEPKPIPDDRRGCTCSVRAVTLLTAKTVACAGAVLLYSRWPRTDAPGVNESGPLAWRRSVACGASRLFAMTSQLIPSRSLAPSPRSGSRGAYRFGKPLSALTSRIWRTWRCEWVEIISSHDRESRLAAKDRRPRSSPCGPGELHHLGAQLPDAANESLTVARCRAARVPRPWWRDWCGRCRTRASAASVACGLKSGCTGFPERVLEVLPGPRLRDGQVLDHLHDAPALGRHLERQLGLDSPASSLSSHAHGHLECASRRCRSPAVIGPALAGVVERSAARTTNRMA